jgi:hypothetical protein
VALPADALTFACRWFAVAAVRRRVPHPERRGAGSVRALLADFRAGIGYLLSVRVLVIMTVVQIIVNLCLATEKLMFYYAKITLGLGAAGVGTVVAAGGAGGIAGAISALLAGGGWARSAWWCWRSPPAAWRSGSMAATHSLVALAAANLAYLWAITVASLANRTYRQLIVPARLLGRVTRHRPAAVLTADPVGVVIAGSLTAPRRRQPPPGVPRRGRHRRRYRGGGLGAGLRRAGPPGGPS